VLHTGMPLDPIQGQGHRGPKVVNSKSISSTGMHVIQRLMVNYDTGTPKQYLNFNLTDFLIFFLIVCSLM